jgi:uncharacterized sulfatase
MGIRTPILLRWPGRTKSATHADLVSSVDLPPTMLAACGLQSEAEKLPGLNLLPLGQGEIDGLVRKAVFGDIYEHDASMLGHPQRDLLYRWVRSGDWKLIDAKSPTVADLLFNLANDPHERTNLAGDAMHRVKLAELQELLDAWWKPGE